MKYFFLVLAILATSACRPVHTTKQYYNEYVNPTASVDYDASVSINIPQEFLDDYYTIDSKIVRLMDQIDLADSSFDDAWISTQKSMIPWIKYIAILDNEMLFVSGDDSLGFDPVVRDFLSSMPASERRVVVSQNDRVFLVHAAKVDPDHLKTTVVEVYVSGLAVEIAASRTALAVGNQIISGQVTKDATELLEKVASSKKYSGSRRVEGRDVYWIRSMGSDNLIYLFSK